MWHALMGVGEPLNSWTGGRFSIRWITVAISLSTGPVFGILYGTMVQLKLHLLGSLSLCSGLSPCL